MNKIGKLIIARHHESEWNKLGKWTGVVEVGLTTYGFKMSEKMGDLIKDIHIDQAFTSAQIRSIETFLCMEDDAHINVPVNQSVALNERDYGDYTGKNKWDMEKILGEENFEKLRRDWDYPVPNGETLKMVYGRVTPFYLNVILPLLKSGKNVLVVAHGNSLRALIKYLEKIPDDGMIHVEMLFGAVIIYEVDKEGCMIKKENRSIKTTVETNIKNSKAQIVATIGPACAKKQILSEMIRHQADVIRFNFSWANLADHAAQISLVKEVAHEVGRNIIIIQDLPGPRVQEGHEHTYDHNAVTGMTEQDKKFAKFGVEHGVDYIALSFVGGTKEIEECREIIKQNSGTQRIIAKIERKIAVESLGEIIKSADAIMVARGDLGNEFPLEQIPFVQEKIIRATKLAGKPVITATQMMLSMVDHPVPTRAEVTDVANAILQGSDAVMLSEESAIGKYPVEAITMMEKIIL
ncbi:MAG: pyruvate kinase [Candidatus Paceibacterota bacterium]